MRSPDRPRGRAPTGAERLITVATYSEAMEAQMGRSALIAHGIRAFIADEHVSTLTPHYIGRALGIRLQVPHSDLERATEILKSPHSDEDHDNDEEDDAAELDGPKCPTCAARYAYREWSPGQVLAIVVLLGLPLLVLKKQWHCRKCDTYWRPGAAPPKHGNPYRAPRGATLRGKR
ncbi:DUF2007 domain-containing protein [Sorangium cellulosum]|uniref:putative signal transducing protein n=1 Tax=Sorangium cellulosum TaxID=56 RepID=UPI0013314901|nr:DUF2007 domain-containing protein [Sorangium cellulosum]